MERSNTWYSTENWMIGIGQEQAGTGRVFTYDTPTPISTVIENVKKHIGLPYCK